MAPAPEMQEIRPQGDVKKSKIDHPKSESLHSDSITQTRIDPFRSVESVPLPDCQGDKEEIGTRVYSRHLLKLTKLAMEIIIKRTTPRCSHHQGAESQSPDRSTPKKCSIQGQI